MKTRFNKLPTAADWVLVKNHCRTTVSKEFTEKEPSDEFKRKLLMAEHSPIRLLEFDWTWDNIPYWVSTELSRHKFEKFISSQRDDRKTDTTPRAEKRQDAPVRFDGYANMQSLIDAWRKRMCYQATTEARELAYDFKDALAQTHPLEASVLVPNCVYRGGCNEMHPCGYWAAFARWASANDYDLTDLTDRYEAFNEFYTKQRETRMPS